jgi:hypothetical protein
MAVPIREEVVHVSLFLAFYLINSYFARDGMFDLFSGCGRFIINVKNNRSAERYDCI